MKKQKWKLLALLVALVLMAAACSGNGSSSSDGTGKKQPETSSAVQAEDAARDENDSEKADSSKDLYARAVEDSVFAEESEIQKLVSLTKDDELVSWDEQGRVMLCTWHNYPDSYPEGEKVKIAWGPVWAFTDLEIASHADELKESEDAQMRLKQLISFAPDSEHTTFTGFWVDPANVRRPAYQSDPTDGSMKTAFEENVDEEFKSWFDENILWSYFYGSYPWTRLGYTYDWADNGSEYGMTEFIVEDGAEVEVAFTETTQEFLDRMVEK